MPTDPALYARTLSAAGYFESIAFSAEDAKRAGFYQDNAQRAALQKQVGDVDAYLATLAMEIWFQPFDEVNRARIAQLINKSNQFNLTTRRYSEADVARLQDSPEYFTLQVRLKDTFGDNGMISVIICRLGAEAWEIDTWLMSCRVLGRRVEHMVLRELLSRAQRAGARRLVGAYIPTDRNKIVVDHYRNLGFECAGERPDGGTNWSMDVSEASLAGVPSAAMVVHAEGFTSDDAGALAHSGGNAPR
jgi:FkbH-like protein